MSRNSQQNHSVPPTVDARMERGDAAEGAGPVDHDHDHDHDHPTRPTPFEHEHDHDDRSHGGFPHERLDAYRVALTMATASKRVAAGIPRGHRSVADHMLRAAANVVLLLPEGANRRTPKENDSDSARAERSALRLPPRPILSSLSNSDPSPWPSNSNTWPDEWRRC